jgi:hypothetical protein
VWLVVVMPLKPLANSLRLGSTWKPTAGPSDKSRFCRVARFREVHFQGIDAGFKIGWISQLSSAIALVG